MILKLSAVLIFYFILINSFAQKQNNTLGSEIFADCPYRILQNQSIPLSVYIHESECTNCNNDLIHVNISLKSPFQSTYSQPLTFDTLSPFQFNQLFSDYSIEDITWGVQDFLSSLPVKSNEKTIQFTKDTNVWIPPIAHVQVNARYFYFTFNIPYSVFSNYYVNGAVDIKVDFGLDYEEDQSNYFRVFFAVDSMPTLQNWKRGDTHFHSIFTQNDAENGLPLESTKKAAAYLGLDWTTVTDHSCDFDNYGTSMNDNWNRLGEQIQQINLSDSNFIFIRGMEASINNSDNKIVHALAYPNPLHPFSLPYLGDGGGDLSSTQVSVNSLLDSLKKHQGFCYAAHPFADGDKLSDAIGGGIWNINDSLLPWNGNSFNQSYGTVICNDQNLSSDIYSNSTIDTLISNPLVGGQIWNLWNSLSCTDTETDPWNTLQESNLYGLQITSETTTILNHKYRLHQNFEAYESILKRGLKAKNENPNIKNWKFFISGGSDAHGSFNYSVTDFFGGGLNGEVNDNCPGKIATLAYCPYGMGQHGENVLKALRNGNTVISSGPIVAMYVLTDTSQTESESIIAIPGNDLDVSNINPAHIFIELHTKTSNDFGSIVLVQIILNTQTDQQIIEIPLTSGFYRNSLSELINMAWGSNFPFNQYISLRATITTLKTYNFNQSTIFKKTHEFFNCYTNPVWLKTGLLTQNNNLVSNELHIFPNPVQNQIFVQFNTHLGEIKELKVFDIQGKEKRINYSISEDLIHITFPEVKKGLYYIQLIFDSIIVYSSFIKE